MPRNSRRNESTNSLIVSRVSEIAEEFSSPPSRIPMEKWKEILESEYASHVAGFIREEIVRSAADIIYEGYLRKMIYGFVVNCAYDIWMRMFREAHPEYDDREKSDVCAVPEEAPPPVTEHPRPRRGVPTVYGRLAKVLASQKSSRSRREATCAKGALHGRSGRSNLKIRN